MTIDRPSPSPSPDTSTPPQTRRPVWLDRVLSLLGRMFGTDLRSLAAFRMALGLVMLFDLLERWPTVTIHYTDQGLLTREEAIDGLNPWRWSLYFVNGSSQFVHAMFAITALVTLAVIVGYRTRPMTVAMWVLLVSLQARNPLVLSGADAFLRLLTFWAMFLPLGAVWSVDRWRDRETAPPRAWYASVASAALLLQIAFVYLFTALLKTGDPWRKDFDAIWYALGAEHLTTSFGAWLHQFPDLLRPLTVATMAIEIAAPVILFVPWRNALMRCIGIGAIVGLQIGIMATLNLGIFPWISTLCMVCFLPTVAWDRLLHGGTRLVHRFLPGLQGRWQHAWGTDGAVSATSDRAKAASPIANLLAAGLLLVVLGWNITSVSAYTMPRESRPVVYGLAIYQKWAMFAPKPPRSTQWPVIEGTLANGTTVNLLEPLVQGDMTLLVPLTWDRPADIGEGYYGNKYWRKYFTALEEDGSINDRLALSGYLCRHWNAVHGENERLATVTLHSVFEDTLPNGEVGEQRQIERSHYVCS